MPTSPPDHDRRATGGFTMTVGAIFDAIEELAAGSTHLVKRRKVDSVDNHYIGLPETKTATTE
jgi:hypothetical protein